jgi:CDP-glucose 4,6-dehydratase
MAVTDWRGKRVFVTGGTGLLGSGLVDRLLELGAEVTCLVRDWVPASRLVTEGGLERVNVVHGELEDGPLLLRALNEYEIDSVFHLGAQTIVGTASRSTLSTFESNIKGTWLLLDACRELGRRIERVVVASSDKAYGEHETLPYTEDAPLQGRYPYDVSKSCADLISISYHRSFGLPVAITRCGNLYGAGDLNFNRLVPGTIRSALADERPVVRSDGTLVRDYFFVKDAVEAYLRLAARLPDPAFDGEAFNFGTETPMSVMELVALILRLMGKEHLEPDVLGQANNEIPAQYLDCAKARRLLGWKPAYTLEEGILETVGWYRDALARKEADGAGDNGG